MRPITPVFASDVKLAKPFSFSNELLELAAGAPDLRVLKKFIDVIQLSKIPKSYKLFTRVFENGKIVSKALPVEHFLMLANIIQS